MSEISSCCVEISRFRSPLLVRADDLGHFSGLSTSFNKPVRKRVGHLLPAQNGSRLTAFCLKILCASPCSSSARFGLGQPLRALIVVTTSLDMYVYMLSLWGGGVTQHGEN